MINTTTAKPYEPQLIPKTCAHNRTPLTRNVEVAGAWAVGLGGTSERRGAAASAAVYGLGHRRGDLDEPPPPHRLPKRLYEPALAATRHLGCRSSTIATERYRM
jgi:hypothetical protein